MVRTESCQKNHVGVCVSEKLMITNDDGSVVEVGPGDAYKLAPEHDAWLLGGDVFVVYEFDISKDSSYVKK